MSKHTFSEDGSSSAFSAYSQYVNVVADGTFDSGTLTVELYDEANAEWFTVYSYTAKFQKSVMVGVGNMYRFTLTGSTTPSLSVYHIPAR